MAHVSGVLPVVTAVPVGMPLIERLVAELTAAFDIACGMPIFVKKHARWLEVVGAALTLRCVSAALDVLDAVQGKRFSVAATNDARPKDTSPGIFRTISSEDIGSRTHFMNGHHL